MTLYTLDALLPEFDAYWQWLDELSAASTARAGMPVSRWYKAKGLALYTRHGPLIASKKVCPGLCLANIELTERRRGRGYFGLLLQYLVQRAPERGYAALAVESVNNERLLQWLLRRGFEPVRTGEMFPGASLVKLLPEGA